MELYEALYTTRAMRRVSPDPVPEDAVKIMLDAAVRAPSGGNTQNWRFLTVTDETLRAELGALYRQSFVQLQETVYKDAAEQAKARGDEGALRVMSSSAWLAENFEQVPLWVFAFHRNDPTGTSIYPAVWNMMLAAHGQGVGTCLTTILGFFKEKETFDLLGVPQDKGWSLSAAVSCGSPPVAGVSPPAPRCTRSFSTISGVNRSIGRWLRATGRSPKATDVRSRLRGDLHLSG